MFGYFNSAYCLTDVSAGLITTFGLGFFDSQTYFYITTALGPIATIYCYFFVRNITEETVMDSVIYQSASQK